MEFHDGESVMTNFERWTNKELLDQIEDTGEELTSWELGFVKSMKQRMPTFARKNEALPGNMREKLVQIVDERCNLEEE